MTKPVLMIGPRPLLGGLAQAGSAARGSLERRAKQDLRLPQEHGAISQAAGRRGAIDR